VPDIAGIINFGIGDQNGTRYSWNPKTKAVPPHIAVEVRKHYYSAVTWVDHLVGLLVADLKRLDLDQSTIIVFHSDHGYFQGESGEWEKKMLFENTARVPLLIYDPASPTAKRSFELAELVDVYPTMVALANLPAPAAGAIDGTDLSSVVRGASSGASNEERGGAPIKAAAFTQYPRCPPKGRLDVIQEGACYNNPGTSFSYMGFSVRTQQWRYTEWRKWNPSKTKKIADVVADWTDSGVVATELYEMENCRASSPDVFDRQLNNVAKDVSHATAIVALQKLIKQHFI
jgi:arylsulfatase A-like enzyme